MSAADPDGPLLIAIGGPEAARKRFTAGLTEYLSPAVRTGVIHGQTGSDGNTGSTALGDGSTLGPSRFLSLMVLQTATRPIHPPAGAVNIRIHIEIRDSPEPGTDNPPVFARPDITLVLKNEADIDLWIHHIAVALETIRRAAFPASSRIPIPPGPVPEIRRLEGCPDSAQVFDRILGSSAHTVWLDSSNADSNPGPRNRFSIMADDSGPGGRVATYSQGVLNISKGSSWLRLQSRFFEWLSCAWTPQADAPDYPCEFTLGWLGYLGYELKRETGGADIRSDDDLPEAALVFADRAIVLDHQENCTYLLMLRSPGFEESAEEWCGAAQTAIQNLVQSAGSSVPTSLDSVPEDRAVAFTARDCQRTYLDKIRAAQMEITDGNSYEVCLTTQLIAETDHPIAARDAYGALRRHSPAPFASYLDFGDFQIASSSPERFLRINRSGTITAEPIKGTRPRLDDLEKDSAIKRELAASTKDRTENIMIVDLMRNDLSRSADPASVRVTRLCDIESYATVHQMVSTIEAELLPGLSRAEAIAAAFPAGSMTGVPKRSTMAILDSLEGMPRGIYSGAIGYFSLSGAADLSVTIRTLVIQRTHINGREGQRLSLGIGGAITADSIPEDEYDEIRTKAFGVLNALGSVYPTAKNTAKDRGGPGTYAQQAQP